MIVYGAAPMSPDRLREGIEIFGKVFVQLYGQTEAPQCITTMRKIDHDDSKPGRLGSCGRPSPLVDVKLFDRRDARGRRSASPARSACAARW